MNVRLFPRITSHLSVKLAANDSALVRFLSSKQAN